MMSSETKNLFRGLRQVFCMILCFGLLFLQFPVSARAAELTFTLEQARALALAGSREYRKIKTTLNLKQAEYADAVKSIWMKQKDMMTFRWTPLLSFQFPEWPDLADSYDWQYKPVQIQNEITGLVHELNDIKYEVIEEASILFTDAYIIQEKLAFTEERMEKLEDSIQRTEWKFKLGESSLADLETLNKSREKITGELSLLMHNADTAWDKLAKRTGLDTPGNHGLSGYHLEDPLISAKADRTILADLTGYTLKNDQTYYEAQLQSKLGKLSLELNERLMRQQYGGKMDGIQAFLNQVKQGQEIEEDVFKDAYDRFLETVDRPWNGSLNILFLKIPKEWFKGSLDGVRYIEDEPYALYTAALEYTDLLEEEENARSELTGQVTESFEAMLSAGNAYRNLEASAEKEEGLLEKNQALNQLGKLTLEELKLEQESYEELQIQVMDALAEYSRLLYSFDRLTCGGFTRYLNGETLDVSAASGGESYLEEEPQEASYYIRSIIEEQMFELGVSFPEGFTPEITDFELWVNGVRIGERTPVSVPIRHLTLALDGIDTALIRLFNHDELVLECEIETMVSTAPLFGAG